MIVEITVNLYPGEGNPPNVEGYLLRRQMAWQMGAVPHPFVFTDPEAEQAWHRELASRIAQAWIPKPMVCGFDADQSPPPSWWQDWEPEPP